MDTRRAILGPPYYVVPFINPLFYGSIKSTNYTPNCFMFFHSLNSQMDICFRDEFAVFNRFRCSVGGPAIGNSAFNLLYNISSDTYLSSLTNNSPVCLELVYSFPNILSFVVNGKVIAQTLLGTDGQNLMPLMLGVGGYKTNNLDLGNLIITNYSSIY
jgi:hypothetical protein